MHAGRSAHAIHIFPSMQIRTPHFFLLRAATISTTSFHWLCGLSVKGTLCVTLDPGHGLTRHVARPTSVYTVHVPSYWGDCFFVPMYFMPIEKELGAPHECAAGRCITFIAVPAAAAAGRFATSGFAFRRFGDVSSSPESSAVPYMPVFSSPSTC